MLREFLTLGIPLVLPTALYLAWMAAARRPHAAGAVVWHRMPWLWLAVSGVVLTALVLFGVTVGFGTAVPGVYVPPHAENGRIVPGHIAPAKP